FEAVDAEEEGWFVAGQTTSELAADEDSTVAVLYRTNAQSRVLEEALRRGGVDYRMVGSFSFYARAEIKDVLAYARLASNLRDSASFARILNMPVRGIGEATLGALEEYARERKITLWEAREQELAENRLPLRALMTLHTAKGLEFSTVYLVGLEEGLFPHKLSAGSEEEIEEERRLCYVGMTRAKDRLVLTRARQRRWFGQESSGLPRPSRFLREI